MHVQAAVDGFDRFVRCIGFGPQTHCVLYDPTAPLHDRYTTKTDFITQGRGGAPPQGHADDQRVLRLGVQLLRGAPQGRRLVPDRLREPVPRLAGDVAALPLPVAGEGVHPLGGLLRGDEAQDAQEPGLGAVLSRSRRWTSRIEEKLDRYAAIADERFETDAVRGVLREAPRAPRRGGVGVLRHAGGEGRRPPEGGRALPGRTRSRSSPSCSGGASRTGAPPVVREGDVSDVFEVSLVLGARRMRGHPRSLGPRRPARARLPDRRRRRRGDRALRHHPTCSSRSSHAGASRSTRATASRARLVRQGGHARAPHVDAAPVPPVRQHEVVPGDPQGLPSDDIAIWTAGASIGAFHAAAVVCRFPDIFHSRARDERHVQPHALHRGEPPDRLLRRASPLTSCRTSRAAPRRAAHALHPPRLGRRAVGEHRRELAPGARCSATRASRTGSTRGARDAPRLDDLARDAAEVPRRVDRPPEDASSRWRKAAAWRTRAHHKTTTGELEGERAAATCARCSRDLRRSSACSTRTCSSAASRASAPSRRCSSSTAPSTRRPPR